MHNMSNLHISCSSRRPHQSKIGQQKTKKNIPSSDKSQFLRQNSDGRVRIRSQQHERMGLFHLVAIVQVGGEGIMMWGVFSGGPLVPAEHRLNTAA